MLTVLAAAAVRSTRMIRKDQRRKEMDPWDSLLWRKSRLHALMLFAESAEVEKKINKKEDVIALTDKVMAAVKVSFAKPAFAGLASALLALFLIRR